MLGTRQFDKVFFSWSWFVSFCKISKCGRQKNFEGFPRKIASVLLLEILMTFLVVRFC